jgi:putative cell wall-binding protein
MKRNYLTVFTLAVFFVVFSVTNAYASISGSRLAGADRYSTSVSVAASGWGSGASTVILATGENFPDALSAVTIAKKYDAPIILTTTDTINTDAYNEIKALGAKTVYIVGGIGVVSNSAANSLGSLGITVERLAGSDRFETSVKIADKLGPVNEAFIVTGEDFPDALSVAPIAAQKGIPILLTAKDNLPDSVKSYLESNNITKKRMI